MFRDVFYGKIPEFQKIYLEKKRATMEEELRDKKVEFSKKMKKMSKSYAKI